jgi:peptidoglycan LD-endopeptidase LytH
MRSSLLFAALAAFLTASLAAAQQPPQIPPERAGDNPRAAEIRATACTLPPEDDGRPSSADLPSRQTPEWRAEYALRQTYRPLFPEFLAAVPLERDAEVLMPVEGVYTSQVADTWGAARSEGRTHEGTDIFAPAGTPIYSATPGYVYRIGTSPVGGNVVSVIGGAGVRYYYAHLSEFAEGLEEGQYVTPETLLGYVGNTGNAISTPPHLHLGIYAGDSYLTCDWEAENPYSLLVDRDW